MCGKCEAMMGKASTVLGVVMLLVAAASKLGHFGILGAGAKSFAAAAAILLLLAIAANTCPSAHHEGQG